LNGHGEKIIVEATYPSIAAQLAFLDDYFRNSMKSHIRFYVGTYTGDAAATKAITGVGFKPTILLIYEQVTNKYIGLKTSKETTKALIIIGNAANVYADDLIISLDADGFTIGDGTGSANYMNEAQAYVYVAFG
jgi:hypothetical protein